MPAKSFSFPRPVAGCTSAESDPLRAAAPAPHPALPPGPSSRVALLPPAGPAAFLVVQAANKRVPPVQQAERSQPPARRLQQFAVAPRVSARRFSAGQAAERCQVADSCPKQRDPGCWLQQGFFFIYFPGLRYERRGLVELLASTLSGSVVKPGPKPAKQGGKRDGEGRLELPHPQGNQCAVVARQKGREVQKHHSSQIWI